MKFESVWLMKYFLLLYAFLAVSCTNRLLTASENLYPKHIHYGSRGGAVVVNIGKPKWCVDSIRVDGKINVVSDDLKSAQREGLPWGSIANEWLEVRGGGDVTEMEIIARNRKRDVYKQGTFVIYLNEDSITGTIDVVRDGDWDDMIGLSEEHVVFSKDGGMKDISTIYHSWWISRLHIGDKILDVSLDDRAQLINTLRFKKTIDWLTIEVFGRKIRLSVTPNSDNKKRTFKIELVSGNYSTSFSGEQNF